MKKYLFLSPLLLIALTGCTINTKTTSDNKSNQDSSITPSDPIDGDPEIIDSEEYLELFNPTSLVSLEIKMSLDAARFMNDYQTNHSDSTYFDYYVPCNVKLTLNGRIYEFEEVGIRVKGNLSRNHFLNNDNFSLDSLSHYKLSFKQTFDDAEYDNIPALNKFKKTWDDTSKRKERKNRTLFGMEKIDLKWNRNGDETKLKQAYTLKTFRDQNLLAQHDTLGIISLGIKDKSSISTTYEILECIDDIFIKRHFPKEEAAGDLYKCTYTSAPANFSSNYTVGNQIGVENNANNYHPSYDLKTNKKKSTHTDLLNLIRVFNENSTPASTYKNKLEQYFDVTNFVKEEAIAFIAGNPDDFRNNMNNYYLYFSSTSHRAYYIPYDFDRCFGMGTLAKQEDMTNFSAESTKMQLSGNWQESNIFWRTICSNTSQKNIERIEEYRNLYQTTIEQLLNNKTISTESFNNYVTSYSSTYGCNKNGAGYDYSSGNSNITFSNYLSKKISKIKQINTTYDIKVS